MWVVVYGIYLMGLFDGVVPDELGKCYITSDQSQYVNFVMNQDAIIQNIDDMIDTWLAQKELHLEIKAYKEHANSTISEDIIKFDLAFHDNYIQFLDEATKSILALRTKITNTINNTYHHHTYTKTDSTKTIL